MAYQVPPGLLSPASFRGRTKLDHRLPCGAKSPCLPLYKRGLRGISTLAWREHYALARIDDCPEHDNVAPEDVYDYIHNALTYWNARGAVQAIRMQDTDVLSIIRRKK